MVGGPLFKGFYGTAAPHEFDVVPLRSTCENSYCPPRLFHAPTGNTGALRSTGPKASIEASPA